jgi:hypothetical protein
MKNILIPNTWVATACGSRGKPQKAEEGPKGQDMKPALRLSRHARLAGVMVAGTVICAVIVSFTRKVWYSMFHLIFPLLWRKAAKVSNM